MAAYLFRRRGDDFLFIEANPPGRALAAGWVESALGRPAAECLRHEPEVQAELGRAWRERQARRRVVDVGLGGPPRRLELVAVPVPPDWLVLHLLDLAASDPALKASEQRYRAIVEAEPQCVKVLAPDGRLVEMNPAGLRMIEAGSLEAVRGMDLAQLVTPAHRDSFRELHRRVMAGGSGSLQFEILGLQGGRRWLETHAVPLRDAEGNVAGLLGITADITERRRAEEELRRSESRYRSLVEGAAYGIYRSTPDGRLLLANPALVAMLGYESEAELLSADWAAQVYQDRAERERLLQEYGRADRFVGVEAHWQRKDGTPIVVRLSGRAVRDAAGQVAEYEVMVEDVTARRALEEQLRQAQKMEVVGQLAGGIAHDFNNLLTAILGSADFLLGALAPDDTRREDVVAIREAGQRAAALTRQLLAFSRRQVLAPRILDLNQVVSRLDSLLRRVIGEHIQLITRLAPQPALVNADPSQIEQVILNLVVNARDAMPQGGRVTLETAVVELDPAFAARHPTTQPGPYVRLSVSDTGAGMDPATKARIFEPFFTTKGPGKGSGLGLATVYGIVKQSEGYIWVESEPGQGSRFEVYLPRVAEAVEEPGAVPEPLSGLLGGSETILLVEDDAGVRAVTQRILERHGYRVLAARDGREALELVARHRGAVDLMLTDLVMPEMGGRHSAERLRLAQPGMKVLYMSGYPGEGQEIEPGSLVAKPFSPEALLSKVREVLDA